MSRLPRSSPWGAVQKCEVLSGGVYRICTRGQGGWNRDGWLSRGENVGQAAQGGIMVRRNAAGFLSPEARKEALNVGNYLCYAENGGADIVVRELLDKGMLEIHDSLYDMAGYEDGVNRSLQHQNPEYWEARQQRLDSQPAQPQAQMQTKPQMQTDMPQSIPPSDKSSQSKPQHEQPGPPTLAGRLEAYRAKAAAQNTERKTPDMPRRAKGETVH